MLSSKRVGVVGLGAIGSFTADLLARSGVRRFHLQDGEILRPGNCVRHLLDQSSVGKGKAQGVKDYLCSRYRLKDNDVYVAGRSLTSVGEARDLLSACDVVVDATASNSSSAMLAYIAEAEGKEMVSVCALREGGVVRCDRWPLVATEAHRPPPPTIEPTVVLREGGCCDPVSGTPPVAVLSAAELATRMTLDRLTGTRGLPPSMTNVLCAQPNEPYATLGLVV